MSRYHLSIQTAPHNSRMIPSGWAWESIDEALRGAREADRQWMSVHLIDSIDGRRVDYRGYEIVYRGHTTDQCEMKTETSLRRARQWARAFVARSYCDEASARIEVGGSTVEGWVNRGGRAVRS